MPEIQAILVHSTQVVQILTNRLCKRHRRSILSNL